MISGNKKSDIIVPFFCFLVVLFTAVQIDGFLVFEMNYNDFSHEINRMAANMRSSLLAPNSNSDQNSMGRPWLRRCQKLEPHEYNESGKPLQLPYDSSGLPLRHSNLNRIGGPDMRDTYNSSGKVFHLTDFLRNDAYNGQGSIETCNTFGRVLHLSDFPEDEAGSSLEQIQWPQVPPEGGWNTSNLSRTLKIPSEVFQDSAVNFGRTKRDKPCAGYPRYPQLREDISQFDKSKQHPNEESYSIPGRNQFTCTQDMPECSHLSQSQLVELLKMRHADKTTSNNYFEIPLFNALVKDNYYPGAIEDAVNGQIQFNKIAFDAVFNSDPPMKIKPDDVPLTLLEAFELRIHFEDNIRTNPSTRSRCCAFRKKEEVIESKDETEEVETAKIQFWTHPDELKLASTVDIDLESNVREYPETALTRAIASLFKAEKMNEFDKKVHVAEEAMRSVPPDQQEKAALISTPSFKLNLQKGEKVTTKSYKPIEIVSYIGTTKPNE